MTLNVLFFAVLAHEIGQSDTSIDLPDGATVADALDVLAQAYPAVAAMRGRLAVAVDMSYVKPAHVLKPGNQIALIPPVSGG